MAERPTPITSPPSSEELAARLHRVWERMEAESLDIYVSFNPVNVYYLTHFANYVHERPFLLIIQRDEVPTLLAPQLELSHVEARARAELRFTTYYEYPAPQGQNWYEVFAALIADSARVGIESAMPVGIAAKTPGQHTVTDIIDEVRLIKTDYEIGRTVHACGILNLGHRKLTEISRPGVAEIAIYNQVVGTMMGHIFEDIPDANTIVTKFLAGVWPPSISHDPHRIPKPTTLLEEGGPHVSIIAGQVDGYGVELERTFFLGSVPEHAKRPFEVMLEARRTAFDMAKPGVILADIDEHVRKVIIDAGYGDYILHRTGHGFGITGHEAPFVALGDDRELAPNMLISIEPGIYIPGQGGYRHSDTVWITEEGPACLTEAGDTLEALTFG